MSRFPVCGDDVDDVKGILIARSLGIAVERGRGAVRLDHRGNRLSGRGVLLQFFLSNWGRCRL